MTNRTWVEANGIHSLKTRGGSTLAHLIPNGETFKYQLANGRKGTFADTLNSAKERVERMMSH
jgi:hypothetical protein